MDMSRRSFIATSLAGVAVAYAARGTFGQAGASPAAGMPDEDGSHLWLRYAPPPNAASYSIKQVVVEGQSPTLGLINDEIQSALFGMFKRRPGGDGFIVDGKTAINDDAVIVGTPQSSPTIRGMNLAADLDKVGAEGYIIRSTTINGKHVSII